ncbi:MAG: aspartate kinase [Xanthomonadales bacterium]|nr:aspartate kinase [Xanthomonadales bacterium]NIX14161.1 aspartate kinase [Xanthomonadales bacterium]
MATAQCWDRIAGLVRARLEDDRRIVVVCSALAGVTDELQVLADGAGDPAVRLERILAQHEALAGELGIDAGATLDEGRKGIGRALDRLADSRQPAAVAELLAWGEWLSTRLGHACLARSLDVAWVDAREALCVLPESNPDSRRAWLSARCDGLPDAGLAERWAAGPPVLLTQGFVARAPDGRTALLGRGGSDTSAALLAARLGADCVEIWTDVPGLFSADPRIEPAARLIPELDYAEALELAASGARVVHPRCIRVASEAGISVSIRDLGDPHARGTRISETGEGEAGIKAVARIDGMLVLLLENLDTRQQVGFLAWVFEVISARGVSVDLVATSETTTTVAIDQRANLLDADGIEDMVERLGARCNVRQYPDCSCVNLVGRGARTALARMGPAAAVFDEVPLLMLSQSANDLSISMLVPAAHAERLCRALHGALIRSAAG